MTTTVRTWSLRFDTKNLGAWSTKSAWSGLGTLGTFRHLRHPRYREHQYDVRRTTSSGASTHLAPARTRPASSSLDSTGATSDAGGTSAARVVGSSGSRSAALGVAAAKHARATAQTIGRHMELCKPKYARSPMKPRASVCNRGCRERSASEHVITNPPYPHVAVRSVRIQADRGEN